MARFAQGLIQGLTQPSFGQGLFNLGGQIAERRQEREQMARLDESMTTMRQANAAAQQGDVSALTTNKSTTSSSTVCYNNERKNVLPESSC